MVYGSGTDPYCYSSCSCWSCWDDALKKSLMLRCFKSDRDEIWHDYASTKYALADRVIFLTWCHTFKMAAMTSFHMPTTNAAAYAAYVRAINDWMSASRMKLNPTKTEVLWLGSSQQLSQIGISDILLQSTTTRVVESARDLGVVSTC